MRRLWIHGTSCSPPLLHFTMKKSYANTVTMRQPQPLPNIASCNLGISTFHIKQLSLLNFCKSYFLRAFAEFRKVTISFVTPVSFCPSALNNSAPTGRIFIKFRMWEFFEISGEYLSFTQIWQEQGLFYMNTVYIYDNISLNLLRTRNVSDIFVEKIKTNILYSVSFSRKSCCFLR